jgi:hypothetical protein
MSTRKLVRCLLIASGLGCAAVAAVPGRQSEPATPPVDHRVTPLQQSLKIHAMLAERGDRASTMTVMFLQDSPAAEWTHLVLAPEQATADNVREQLFRPGVDGVSWSDPDPHGACDSQQECEQKTDDLCQDSGNGKVKPTSVKITTHSDGTKSCTGNCASNGAVAFITCLKPECLLCQ